MSKAIPLSAPSFNGSEWQNVKECLDTGWVSSAGEYVDRFEADICRLTGAKHAVAVSSGTAALQIALQLIGVGAEDEVIVPTVTFIAPVNAVHYLRAVPVFMDCDDFYNMDARKTIEFIENETVLQDGFSINRQSGKTVKAIMPVHVYGNAADLAELAEVCRSRNIKIIEDATESLGTVYREGALNGRHTGTIGDIGCFSFNGNKIITTGGGGMMVTNSDAYADRARYLTTQAKDDAVRYVHNEVGYNFRLNNIQSAIGVAQLKSLDAIIETKKRHYGLYKKLIDGIDGLAIADVPAYASNNYWMYALQIDAKKFGRGTEEVMQLFYEHQIEVRPLWYLNHLQKPYKDCQNYNIEKAYALLDATLSIPCSIDLSDGDIGKIAELLKQWKK